MKFSLKRNLSSYDDNIHFIVTIDNEKFSVCGLDSHFLSTTTLTRETVTCSQCKSIVLQVQNSRTERNVI